MILQNLPPPLSDDQRIPALEGLTLAQVTPRLPLNSPTSTLQTLYARSRDGDQIPYQRAGVWHVAIHNPPETYNAAFQRRDYQIVELRVDQFAPYVIKLTMRPDANGEVFAAQLAKDTPSIADYVFPIVAGWLLGPNLIVQIVGQTALNGGDLAGALKSSLFGVAGGAVGGFVGDAVSSDIAGRIAGSTAANMFAGQGIEDALKNSLVRVGTSTAIGTAGDFIADVIETGKPPPIQGDDMDFDIYGSSDADFSGFDPLTQFAQTDLALDTFDFGSIADPLQSGDDLDFTNFADASKMTSIDPSSGTVFQLDPSLVGQHFSDARYDAGQNVDPAPAPIAAVDYADAYFDYGSPPPFDTSTPVYTVDPRGPFSDARYDATQNPRSAPSPTQVPSANSPYTFAAAVQGATSLALAAIQVSQAYQRAQRPASVPAGSRVSTGGNRVTAQPDGRVTVRTTDGKVQAQRPPVGVPYATADGGVIVNNGDGTYTYASNSGATVTRQYTAEGGASKALMYGGAALAAVLLLSR
jgi:hypothetical protein